MCLSLHKIAIKIYHNLSHSSDYLSELRHSNSYCVHTEGKTDSKQFKRDAKEENYKFHLINYFFYYHHEKIQNEQLRV